MAQLKMDETKFHFNKAILNDKLTTFMLLLRLKTASTTSHVCHTLTGSNKKEKTTTNYPATKAYERIHLAFTKQSVYRFNVHNVHGKNSG